MKKFQRFTSLLKNPHEIHEQTIIQKEKFKSSSRQDQYPFTMARGPVFVSAVLSYSLIIMPLMLLIMIILQLHCQPNSDQHSTDRHGQKTIS